MAVTQSSLDELIRWQHLDPEAITTLTPDQVLRELQTEPTGLTSEEAAVRLQVIGHSNIAFRRGWRSLVSLLAILVRPLLLPLWIGAIIAFSIDRSRTGQALVIAAALNTLVAAIQERKAERATAALHDALPTFARTMRNGREEHILTTMLVPGDILLLRPNDIIAADARVIESDNLHTVNEILRTDDAIVHKTAEAIFAEDASSTERPNMVYAGGRVISGHGRAVVIATGLRSVFGKIAELTQRAHEEPSPLLLAFARLGIVVLAIGLLGAVLSYVYTVSVLGLTVEHGLGVAVLFLTAAVPVGLMPGITLTLVEGARRLQERQAIFRRLSNVETLGATTVICVDKTGTLTQNEMTVRDLWTADGAITVGGVGYQPQGSFSNEQRPLDSATLHKQADALLRAAVLTSTARLLPPDTLRPEWHILGDAVEAAHIVAAAKAGLKAADIYTSAPQLAVLNSDRHIALDGVIVDEQAQPTAYIKGPPLDVLTRCTALATIAGERPITERDRQAIKKTLQRYQRDAMRTVVFARRVVNQGDARDADIDQIAQQLTLLGMMAVVDPPREEVAEAIKALHSAQIRTIMLTGDDTLGATSIARRCMLVRGARSAVLSGPEIETMDDATLRERLRSGDMVLARLTPANKVRVVEALEALGEVVVVTGGAASDVPALKAAYTGIAMGATGSPAARQAADLVLLDDNFATIAAAIAEGRAVEQRVRRLAALNLGTTVVKLAALIAALGAGLPLLLTVGQQLLIDFLAGLLPGLSIGAGRPDPRLMKRPPRPTGRPLLSRKMYILGYGLFGLVSAALALLMTIVFLEQVRNRDGTFEVTNIFISNLQPYAARIADEAGRRGLIATSMYVVTSVAALLGAALIRRSAAPNNRGPLLLLWGLVALSFAILIAVVLSPVIHPYIALAPIPGWGWAAALGAMILMAALELIRQRLDPIFKAEAAPEQPQRVHNVRSTHHS